MLLLDAAEQAALTPMPSLQLHRMVYLADCLSPIYDVPVADGEVLKYKRGPFFAELHWDLDRLAGMSLVEISGDSYQRDVFGEAWFFADYALSPTGFEFVETALKGSPMARERHDFYIEVAAAYASLDLDARDDAALEDANFRRGDVDPEFVIDYSERRDNASLQAANTFKRFAPPGVRVTSRDKLHLYFRYLNRMVEKRAG